MAKLIHITAAENEKKIINGGIKTNQWGLVFFMPLLPDYLISHQWARELKRSGIKNFIAVEFKMPNDEPVWFGKYSRQHELIPLNQAINELKSLDDQLGYECFIERKVEAKDITRIKHIPKPMGWRYQPHAHGNRPCPCPMCIQAGGYKTNALKEKPEPTMSRNEAKEIIASSRDEEQIWDAITCLQGKWKKYSPEYLAHLLNAKEDYVIYSLIELIAEHRHPLSIEYLHKLAQHPDDDVKQDALEKLEELDLRQYGVTESDES